MCAATWGDRPSVRVAGHELVKDARARWPRDVREPPLHVHQGRAPRSCAGTFRPRAGARSCDLRAPTGLAVGCTGRSHARLVQGTLRRRLSPWRAAADGPRGCPRPRAASRKTAPRPAARWTPRSHPMPLGRMAAPVSTRRPSHVGWGLLVRPRQPLSAVLPCGARRRCVLHLRVELRFVVHDRLGLRCSDRNGYLVRQRLPLQPWLPQQEIGGAVRPGRARTPLGSGAVAPGFCGCPGSPPPCCAQGQCTVTDVARRPPRVDDASPEPGNLGYTVRCVGDAGPVDTSLDTPAVSGVSRWSNGPEVCTSFNGGWACCVLTPPPGRHVRPAVKYVGNWVARLRTDARPRYGASPQLLSQGSLLLGSAVSVGVIE
jgi:hypothetical protein